MPSRIITKVCSRCRVAKPHSEFYKNSARPDKLQNYCKPCSLAANSAWGRAEAAKRPARKYIKTAAGVTEKACSKCGDVKPREEFRQNDRMTSGLSSQCRSCMRPDPAQNAARRARKRAEKHGVYIAPGVDAAVIGLRGKPCFYCGEPGSHVDHVVPMSKGGQHAEGNLVSACRACNLAKSDMLLVEFKAWLRRMAGTWMLRI